MIIGFDGSSIRGGGGVTHLVGVLAAAEPAAHGIDRVVVWGASALLDALPRRAWLDARHEPALEGNLLQRLRWHRRVLPARARASCDVLFEPGGIAAHSFAPVVAMSQNLLPFDPREISRYGLSAVGLRLRLLRASQSRTFRSADGVIFLTDAAREAVVREVGPCRRSTVIPHGIEERFRLAPRAARRTIDCDLANPLRLLYVSIVDVYKHQTLVAEAVAGLRRQGVPLRIDFVGPAYPPELRRLRRVLALLDPRGEFLRYRGPVPHSEMHREYHSADLFVFASTCETFANIVVEAMAAGLPIASSNHGPLREVLGGAGELFDAEDVESIAVAIRRLACDAGLRQARAEAAYARARDFSWARCAAETLAFIAGFGSERSPAAGGLAAARR